MFLSMNIIEDIKPLSFFKQKTGEVINRIKSTKKPTFITVNGNVELVIQDAESYQNMLDYIEQINLINTINNINIGLEDDKNNNLIPAKEGFDSIRKKLKAKI
jgi:PHD/YefM family antitoxin component YafN of YafNO toxin-antitoxin module